MMCCVKIYSMVHSIESKNESVNLLGGIEGALSPHFSDPILAQACVGLATRSTGMEPVVFIDMQSA
jgi:hypothetical protein